MVSIEELRKIISDSLDEEEEVRDRAYSLSRDLIRDCRRFISEAVNGREVNESELLTAAEELIKLYQSPACQKFSFIDDSMVELSEAVILNRTLKGEGLPVPADIPLNERVYVLGACDAVGEMRRVVLNLLLREKLEEAEETFERMNELSYLVEGLSYPSGMIPLKKKQDVVRSLMDRTAGEIAFAKYSLGKR
ncbi:MAG: hypothetical protein ACMUIE_08435 [Thermoplasmatota archaeon]